MNTKKLLTAAAVAAALSTASFGAAASFNNLGTLAIGDTYLSGSEDANISVLAGQFNDVFQFSLSANSGLITEAAVLNFGKFKITDTSFAYSLYSGALSTATGTALATGQNSSGFSLASLSAGTYTLFVDGKATGLKGGQYNGSLTVTAVPEPESYAMLLAGLGLMGTIARRRSKAKAA